MHKNGLLSRLTLIIFICSLTQFTLSAETDRDGLIALYQATDGLNWMNQSGWQEEPLLVDGFNDAPCAEPLWFGVTCEEGRVTRLTISQNGLSGMLPGELTNLSELRVLSLPFNNLNGPLPDLSGLSNLESIELSFNDFSGPIPMNWPPSLQFLDLGSNPLGGEIPAGLTGLSQLNFLNLPFAELTGPIPPELGELSQLQNLRLDANRLSGSIPPELGNLSMLRSLDLSENHLAGPIPPELGNLSDIRQLNLYSNSLTGAIPAEIGDFSQLTDLNLSNNRLAGSIPPELGNLAQLRLLNLSANQLTGSLPPELANLTSVLSLDLSSNQLSGSIPAELGNLSALLRVFLHSNALSGPIPSELGNLANLSALQLSTNQLSGAIPEELGQLSKLQSPLGLAGNRLTGEVPAAIAQLPEGMLDIRGNLLNSVEQGLTDELDQAQIGDARWDVLQHLVAVYPQLAIGGGFEAMLIVSSQSSRPWSGTVNLEGGNWPVDRPWELDGTDMTGATSFPLEIEPFSVKRMMLSSSGGLVDGFLSIRSEGDSRPQDVSAAFTYRFSGDSGLVDSTGVAPAEFSSSYFFPVEQAGGPEAVLTGMAFRSVATSQDSGGLTAELFDAEGKNVGSAFLFNAGQAVLLGEIFPGLPEDFVGTVRVTGGIFGSPFYLTVLRMDITESNGVQLTSIPARALY